MPRIAGTLSALIAYLAMTPLAMADGNLRCGSRLVVTGMSQSEVLQYCGSPLSKVATQIPVRSGNRIVGETTMYRWTYQSQGATRVLVFDLDVLKSIE